MSGSPFDDVLAEVPWLRRFAAGLVRSATDADDLVQDTLRTALHAERPSGPLRGFLAGVARNLARDRRRRDARRGERETRHARERAPLATAPADEDAWRLELLRTLLDELSALPAAQRRAITGRYLDELEPAQIAARDGVSPASVRAQLSRGLAALRARLDRHGGREGWLACLGPWAIGEAFPPLLLPDSSSASALPPDATITAAGNATTPLLAGLAGLAVMKLGHLVAFPVLLLAGLWWFQRDLTPPPLDAGRVSAVAPSGEVAPVELESPAALRDDAARAVVAADPPHVTTPVEPESTPLPLPGTAQLVDLLTGEPVPDMEVVLHCPESGEATGRTLTSDDHGMLALPPDLACASGEMRVVEKDRASDLSRGPLRHARLPFPFREPIPVHVGPTFRLELPDDLAEDSARLVARFRAPGDARPFDDPEARVRAGRAPWIRFPRAVTELEGAVFEVVLEDAVGGRRARIPVRRTRGVEPIPLRPEFEVGGAVRFVLDLEDAAQAPALKVDLEPVGHEVGEDVQLRLFTNHHAADGTVSGTLPMLPPGDYRWNLLGAGGDAAGLVTVHPGETAEVALGPDSFGATFDSEVLLDARATPGADPTRWLVMVSSEDELGAGLMTRPRSVEGQPGRFRIPLKSLSAGSWRVAVNAPAAVSLTPGSVIVTPGAPPEVLRTSPATALASLTLTVLDDATGETLPGATAVVIVVPSDEIELRGIDEERTRLFTDELPGERPVDVFVRAPGRRGVALRHDPSRDPAERTVRLTRGWRSRVLVLDATRLGPVGGIEVALDGERVGSTGDDGWCWIEGDEPPQRVDVARDHPTFEVVMSPYDLGMDTETVLDPPAGIIFLVAPRGAGDDR